MTKTLIITQERNDAIGVVDKEVISRLAQYNDYDFLIIRKKWIWRRVLQNYIINIWTLLLSVRWYQQIFFTRENPFVIAIKLFYPCKKIICTIHHVEKYRADTWLGRQIFRSIDSFVAISTFTKNQLSDCGVCSDQIHVIYNGVSTVYFPEQLDNFKSYPYILYVWSEASRKNLPRLLEAFARIVKSYPDIKLIKAGPYFDESHKQITDQIIAKLWLQDNIVIMRDFIPDENLRKLYSNAICTVLVSTLEGFGLTIPEAMACACPVIVSNQMPHMELVGNNQVAVDPLNIDSVYNGILRIIEDTNLRNLNKQKALERAKLFNWDKCVDDIKKLLW